MNETIKDNVKEEPNKPITDKINEIPLDDIGDISLDKLDSGINGIKLDAKPPNQTFLLRPLNPAYVLHVTLFLIFIAWAFILESPSDIATGLLTIIKSPDTLITDYIELSSFGSALVNAGLYGVFNIIILHYLDVQPNGGIIMALWMTTGFAFFGKNIYNIWPPMIGVVLFAKYQKVPVKNYSLNLLLSTTISPIVTHFIFATDSPTWLSAITGIIFGILGGFFLSIISPSAVRVHNGYNLYNIGFAAGLIMTVIVSLLISFGYTFETTTIWSTTSTAKVATFLYFLSVFLIVWGLLVGLRPYNIRNLKYIFTHSGRLITDFYLVYRETAYINMGIMGIFATSVSLLIGLDLNGPTMGGIFTIIGFAAFGKHLKNVTPVMIGAILSSYLNASNLSDPGNSLAILFSSGLAPIAGQFGPIWGVIAGFIHVAMTKNIGKLTGGLNLYSNGFTAGFVAFILVPIITTLSRKEDDNEF